MELQRQKLQRRKSPLRQQSDRDKFLDFVLDYVAKHIRQRDAPLFLLQACMVLPASAEREWRARKGSLKKVLQLGAWTTLLPGHQVLASVQEVADRLWIIALKCQTPQSPFEFSAIGQGRGDVKESKGKGRGEIVKKDQSKARCGLRAFPVCLHRTGPRSDARCAG